MRRKCGKPPKVLGFSRFAIVNRCHNGSVGMAMNDMTPVIASVSV
jgi:hypothetical protein